MLTARDLVYCYDETTVLDGLSISIDDGTFLILAGENGAGKTTLVKHFNGLLKADEGEVLVNGSPVEDDLVRARQSTGMVFQNPRDSFVASTVGRDVAFGPENLGLDRSAIENRVSDALSAVGMEGREKELVHTLSGGEQARVAIAGALAMDPDHLILDEPLAGLDLHARTSVLSRLRNLQAAGITICYVTHDLRDILDLADRIVIMQNGAIALDDRPENASGQFEALGVRPPC